MLKGSGTMTEKGRGGGGYIHAIMFFCPGVPMRIVLLLFYKEFWPITWILSGETSKVRSYKKFWGMLYKILHRHICVLEVSKSRDKKQFYYHYIIKLMALHLFS